MFLCYFSFRMDNNLTNESTIRLCDMAFDHIQEISWADYYSITETCNRCWTEIVYRKNIKAITDYGVFTLFSQTVMFFMIINAMMLAFTGFYLLLNPKFSKHPYPIIAMTCLVESFQFVKSSESWDLWFIYLFNLPKLIS